MSEQEATTDFTFSSNEIALEPIADEQLGHAEKQHIDTRAFRKCSVTTTISDLRQCFFFDSKLKRRREARICFFEIEFGRQKPGSRQRISDVSVELMFSESDEDEDDDSHQSPGVPDDGELLCKAIYPYAARGAADVGLVSHSVTADVRPAYMDASLGGVSFNKTVKHQKRAMLDFRSSRAGSMGYRFEVSENTISESGLPSLLRFAVLLQTDGLPFTIEMKFVGSIPFFLGTKVGGKLAISIEKRYLWVRSKDDEGTKCCQDADSNAFVEWVKTKTLNPWVEVAEYEV